MLGSSCPKVKFAFKNFVKFTGKHLFLSFFSKYSRNCPEFSGGIFFQDICKWSPLNVLYLMISQKRKDYSKSNKNCKSKGNVYIFKLKFCLKSHSAAYFFKTVLNKVSVIFASKVFLANCGF